MTNETRSLEPDENPNSRFVVDPPWPIRGLLSRFVGREADPQRRDKLRAAFEAKRKALGEPHRVEYFHQLDDPYSYLTAQVLSDFVARYDVEFIPHLVNAAAGKDQPEMDKLAAWARRDCAHIAHHYGLRFPSDAPVHPSSDQLCWAANVLAGLGAQAFIQRVESICGALWAGTGDTASQTDESAQAALAHGTERRAKLGHYSGAIFYYGGEFYWGVDRLLHLERRLQSLGLGSTDAALVPRPAIDVAGVDASALTLHFYPSLNSPYTAIIYDRTIDMARQCGIRLEHKPVLPMVMRGVPASTTKGKYIVFDTKREAELLGVGFGPLVFAMGTPTRNAYSLLAWAKSQDKDIAFMSAALRLAFAEGVSLAGTRGMRRAVTEAGLDWHEAKSILGNDDWKATTARHQQEMVNGMGLWGVPSYRLTGPDGEPDLAVWGQDRLWLIAAEIRRRAGR
ncbi:MAG: DsbA family protein [Pseudomonadota bacterium]